MTTHPDARRSLVGFHAQMNTSDSWPRNTVALLLGISIFLSISMGSAWLAEKYCIALEWFKVIWKKLSLCKITTNGQDKSNEYGSHHVKFHLRYHAINLISPFPSMNACIIDRRKKKMNLTPNKLIIKIENWYLAHWTVGHHRPHLLCFVFLVLSVDSLALPVSLTPQLLAWLHRLVTTTLWHALSHPEK